MISGEKNRRSLLLLQGIELFDEILPFDGDVLREIQRLSRRISLEHVVLKQQTDFARSRFSFFV